MADAGEVRDAIADLCKQACYPNGIDNPSITGLTIRPYSGYPTAKQLDEELRAGICHVGVDLKRGATQAQPVSLSGPEILVTEPTTTWSSGGVYLTLWGSVTVGQTVTAIVDGLRFAYMQTSLDSLSSTAAGLVSIIAATYPSAYSAGAVVVVPQCRSITAQVALAVPKPPGQQITTEDGRPIYTEDGIPIVTETYPTGWVQSGNSITFVGPEPVGQIVILLVDGLAFSYLVASSWTDVAASLVALLTPVYFLDATANGPTITIPGCNRLEARISATGTFVQPLHRQRQEFVVSIYAAGAVNRETIGSAIDVKLAQTMRITLPDQTVGNLRLTWVNHDDRPEKALLFLRQRGVQVEYDTVLVGTTAQIGALTANIIGGAEAQQGEGVFVQAGDKIPATDFLMSDDGVFVAGDTAGSVVGTP